MRPSASTAARTSRPVRKTRTPPPKRSPPPANSPIRKRATTTSSRSRKLLPRSNGPPASNLPKPGRSDRAWDTGRHAFCEHRKRKQRGCSVLLVPVDHAKDVGGNDCDLTSGLDHARTADQAFTGRRRQQVQFVFRRERRLTA